MVFEEKGHIVIGEVVKGFIPTQASLDPWHSSLWSLELSSVFNHGWTKTAMGGNTIFSFIQGKKDIKSTF